MPKRKRSDDDYEHLRKKLKKLERKIRRGKRSRSRHGDKEAISPGTPVMLSDTEDGPSPAQDVTNGSIRTVVLSDKAPVSGLEQPAPGVSGSQATETPFHSDILEILGEDPTQNNIYGKTINNDVAVRFEHCATNGLSKDARKQLTDRYLIPENCKLIKAPALNLEIKAAISELTLKRDKAIEAKQKLLSSAIASLSESITMVLTSEGKNHELLRLLMDTGRILCDCQYGDSSTRRSFILSALKKEMKEQIQSTKVDELLFGQNLSETLKAAKTVNRSGADLKPQTGPKHAGPRPMATTSNPKNWKAPVPYRQPYRQPQPGPPPRNMKPAATRGRPQLSSRPSSQHQRPPQNYRR